MRFIHYFWACFAMAPGTLLYVYYGHIGRQALEGGKTAWDWFFQILGLVAVLAVTVLITRKAKHALAEQTELEDEDVEAADG